MVVKETGLFYFDTMLSRKMRDVLSYRPMSFLIDALQKSEIEDLRELLERIDEPEFHEIQHLKERLALIVKQKEAQAVTHSQVWWRRWEFWLTIIGTLATALLSLLLK